MIINFSVKNYRSFRGDADLTMEADDLRASENIPTKALSNRDVLPVAGIFGANASGKTNILKALDYLSLVVTGSGISDERVKNTIKHPLLANFALDRNRDPVEFEIELLSRDKKREYTYYLSVVDNSVLEESLSVLEKAKTNRVTHEIFSRKKQEIQYDPVIEKEIKDIKKVIAYGEDVPTIVRLANLVKLPVAVDFINELSFVKFSRKSTGVNFDQLYKEPALREKVVNFIKESDTCVQDIKIDKAVIPLKVKEQLNNSPSLPFGFKQAMNEDRLYSLLSVHNNYGDNHNPIYLDFTSDESRGTNRLLEIAIMIIDAIDSGGVLVVDELDSSLHPFLSSKIVKTFQDPNINKKHAQLIFTSHDNYLMSKAVGLRTDQIYLTDKDNNEQSHLTALSEFKVRNNAAVDKQYMDSRFGGVPTVSDEGFALDE
ncbi:AAA family ATPase [Candidatus Saccharibacteria bacterium]|nr:AAA family ATPase [Candidatus Saccharibacteria bacterium]